ncbi:MAG: hypothetical protein FWH26_03370 [Oscillospiraceae bacterium]|nr:hypothetical protein [Oscillospiraceae bacterium]
MTKSKRMLSILLAMALLCGACALGASAAGPLAGVNAAAFAKELAAPADALRAAELTQEQSQEYIAALLPMLVAAGHMRAWGTRPENLVLQSGKTFEDFTEEYQTAIAALMEELEIGEADTMEEIFLSGKLSDYAEGGAAIYEDCVKDHFRAYVGWSLALRNWFFGILPQSLALLLLLR